MTTSRLYVARDEATTVISWKRLRVPGGRIVRRSWSALVESTAFNLLKPDDERTPRNAVSVVVIPLVAGALAASLGAAEVGILAAAVTFFGVAYLEPVVRRRFRRQPGRLPEGARVLTAPAERAAFDRSVVVADSVAETWPRLGSLIDAAEAEAMLTAALWEISGVLARRGQLTEVLADLSRPDFAAHSPSDETAVELRAHREATRLALTATEADLMRREASLARAERAGRDFIREQDMRRAIRDAQATLRSDQPELGPAALMTPADPGADLADHTRSVLDAYRELTADLHSDPPPSPPT